MAAVTAQQVIKELPSRIYQVRTKAKIQHKKLKIFGALHCLYYSLLPFSPVHFLVFDVSFLFFSEVSLKNLGKAKSRQICGFQMEKFIKFYIAPPNSSVINLHRCHRHPAPIPSSPHTGPVVTPHRCCRHPPPVPPSPCNGAVVTSHRCRRNPAPVSL